MRRSRRGTSQLCQECVNHGRKPDVRIRVSGRERLGQRMPEILEDQPVFRQAACRGVRPALGKRFNRIEPENRPALLLRRFVWKRRGRRARQFHLGNELRAHRQPQSGFLRKLAHRSACGRLARLNRALR